MPGYVVHLALAETVLKGMNITDDDFSYMYRIGSIAPDTEKTGHKEKSHFWTDKMLPHFVRKPSLELFLDKYRDVINEPYVMGYYSHLLLDYKFVTEYWKKHYEFYDIHGNECDNYMDVKQVRYLDTDEIIARDEFFSDKYYYGDYDRMNSYLMCKYDISPPVYKEDVIEKGGIKEICSISSIQSLKNMLDYLSREYKGEKLSCEDKLKLKVFDIEELNKLISDTANIILQRM